MNILSLAGNITLQKYKTRIVTNVGVFFRKHLTEISNRK